jgi:hypothetical protein
MARELATYDVIAHPTIDELLDEIERSGEGRVLVRNGNPVAVIQPASPRPRLPRKRKVSRPEDDPLFSISGIFASEEPTDIARFKDEYIADAIERRDS